MTSNVKGQIERKFSKSKNLEKFDFLGALEIRGMQSSGCYCKSITLVWIQVVWAILREDWLGRGGLTSRGGRKSQKVLHSHRNDVSPLIQGLRYRAACDHTASNARFVCDDDGCCAWNVMRWQITHTLVLIIFRAAMSGLQNTMPRVLRVVSKRRRRSSVVLPGGSTRREVGTGGCFWEPHFEGRCAGRGQRCYMHHSKERSSMVVCYRLSLWPLC